MFCPKCRNLKLADDMPQRGWSAFRSNNQSLCGDCGTIMCADRLADEFDTNGYTPNAHVHGHKLDGLISISRLLIETRQESGSTESPQQRSLHFDNPQQSIDKTLTIASDDYGIEGRNASSDRVGRYDQMPQSGTSQEAQSTQYASIIRNRPSPWPVIAFVLALEIMISIGVYASHHKTIQTKHSIQAAPVVQHAGLYDVHWTGSMLHTSAH